MAKKNKLTLEFDGLSEYAEFLEKVGGNLKKTTEKALKESAEHVNSNLHKDMGKHHLTGDTEKSIKDGVKVKWTGNIASVDVGFKIREGGLPSIFLMYGTPRMEPDLKLYNSIYGPKARKEIKEIQKQVFQDFLNNVGV